MSDVYLDIFTRLQRQVQVPLVKEPDRLFSPPLEKIKKAEELFMPSPKHRIEWAARHITGIDDHPPERLPEVRNPIDIA
jgi:hypothetical protein